MMKNIAVSAATVAVCASTTGVMGSVPMGKAAETNETAGGKPTEVKNNKKAAMPAQAKKVWTDLRKAARNMKPAVEKTLIKQETKEHKFFLVKETALPEDEGKELEKSNGHFVSKEGQYYRFRVKPTEKKEAPELSAEEEERRAEDEARALAAAKPEAAPATAGAKVVTPAAAAPEDAAPKDAAKKAAGKKAAAKKVAAPKTYELQVRKAPGVHDAWGLFAKDWETVTVGAGNFQSGVTQVIVVDKKEVPAAEATDGGAEPVTTETDVTLTHEPRTTTARFLQIFFGFQQSLGWAAFKLACWLGAIYAVLHFTVLKRAAVSDEEEGTSCMSDSEEGESDSDVEDLESNLGESIRSGSVRSGSARASAAASVRSGSVKSSQA